MRLQAKQDERSLQHVEASADRLLVDADVGADAGQVGELTDRRNAQPQHQMEGRRILILRSCLTSRSTYVLR